MTEIDRLGRKLAVLRRSLMDMHNTFPVRNPTSTDLARMLEVINDIYQVLKQQEERMSHLQDNEPYGLKEDW